MSVIKHTTDAAPMTRSRAILLIAALTLHAFAADACEVREATAPLELEASPTDAELDAVRNRLDAELALVRSF
jgi:hypothetical protein